MGAMSDNLTQSISNAIMASGHSSGDHSSKAQDDEPAPLSSRKATAKIHHMGKQTSKMFMTDRLRPVTDEDVGPPRKRASHRAKAVRSWKWAKAGKEISDSDSDQEEVLSESEDMGSQDSENSSPESNFSDRPPTKGHDKADDSVILDPQGEPLFNRTICNILGRLNGSRRTTWLSI
ncbi:Hypothetical predicted protein [Pelobates cultripes]|uniref:Uncharacterized protein n=1 Tax=Pelobates cultripes TaxID=61616 RepID=A0AAD1W3N7_PELCU|nr:Hypothetical predicted protein [Pelobates cultripes]